MYDNVNRLLVAGADHEIIETVRWIGEELEYALAEADDASEFLTLVDEFSPSVIVLDLDLPKSDGASLLRALAARGCTASIVVTGTADESIMAATREIIEADSLAIAGSIRKPVDPAAVRRRLTQVRRRDRRIRLPDVQAALDNEQIVAFFQPIVGAAESGGWAVDGLEALVRWMHPTHGLVMPDEFIPQAERVGLIGALTDRVLVQSLQQLRRWQDAGLKLKCSINLPPSLVTDRELPDRLAATIAEHGIEPGSISLEMTETATLQEPMTTTDVLGRIRAHGIGLALDDFGTGFSSLTRLCQLPFSELKIDKSLGMKLPTDHEANTVVGSMIELAHNLGMRVCTEGVESRDALDLLEVLGSDRCQGFFISRALPAREIAGFVRRWEAGEPAQSAGTPAQSKAAG